MTILALEEFNGIAPKLHPRKLADAIATVSKNTRLDRGVLEPWKGITWLQDVAVGVTDFFKYTGIYYTSTARHYVVSSIYENDVLQRVFYTDTDYPKVRSGVSVYRLGLPPAGTPSVAITTLGDFTNITDVIQTTYVVTLVDSWGAEGAPSIPSNTVEVGLGFTNTLDLTSCGVTGAYNLGAGSLFRIYRTNSGSSDSVYQYVGECAYGTASFVDSVASGDLQEALPSIGWRAAPDDDTALYPGGPLQSLIEVPGNILCGHSGNTVFLTEINVPTAWKYYYPNQLQIVGVVMIQGGILILTEGAPYLLTGSSPEAMAQVPIECNEACIFAESIVDFGDYAIYASPNGLVMAQGNSAKLITTEFVDAESWAGVAAATSLVAFAYQGKYIAFYGEPGAGTGFVFDPEGGKNTLIMLEGLRVLGGRRNAAEDTLEVVYIKADGTTRAIGRFNTGELLTYERITKKFMFPDPVSLSCLRVDSDAYPIQVTIYADGAEKGSWAIPSDAPIKLPSGYKAREYQIKVSGTGSVTGIYLTDSMAEMV